ncbi:hypothetical protein [Marinospirillum perlucidum]|uniref:3'-5' exonuclease n=1 Tax=Marinospirillum perlucidum TaxID=1982602 RepID=UPI00319DDFC7
MPFIIDLEASGFGRGSYPIEVGFARPDGQVAARLIKPEPDWTHWSEEAEQVHGISREQLFEEGLSAREVALWLNEELQGETVYSDSWGFDSSWLALLFHHAGCMQRFRIDTLNKLLSEKQLAAWGQIKQQVLDDLHLVRHRAADDAYMLQRTFRMTASQ